MDGSPSERIDGLRRRIEESPDIGAADAAVLREFDDRLEGVSERRHDRLLGYCVALAEGADSGLLAAALDDREAAEALVEWVFEAVENEEENRNFRVALRVLGKRLGDGDDLPPSIGWIPTSVTPEFDTDPGHPV